MLDSYSTRENTDPTKASGPPELLSDELRGFIFRALGVLGPHFAEADILNPLTGPGSLYLLRYRSVFGVGLDERLFMRLTATVSADPGAHVGITFGVELSAKSEWRL